MVDRFRRRAPRPPTERGRAPIPNVTGVTGLTQLASGANAVVYRGDEPAMHRRVAVKVLRARLGDAAGRQAFQDECARAGQIGEHTCAATVYRSGFDGDRPYIVMQYYAGGSLASKLRGGYQFPVAEVLTIGVRIAAALQYAHDLGILHRDVKPENILSDAFGDTVLADFGIAVDRDAADNGLRQRMTAAFAAPEVVQRGGGWPVSDVWSLAGTLYALLAGRPPFYDPARPDQAANLAALAGPLPAFERGDVPDVVHETLAQALIGEPDDRTASARRLQEELGVAMSSLGLSPPVTALSQRPASESSAPTPAYESADTGYLPTGDAYRVPRPTAGQDKPVRQRAWLKLIIAAGVGLIVVLGGLTAYALAGHKQQVRNQVGGKRVSAPSPPTDVKATALRGTSVLISWKNSAPTGRYRQVVISLGTGQRSVVVADHSPQVINGLNPAKPYCFAVGYVYNLQGAVSYSTPPACIRGGVPSSG